MIYNHILTYPGISFSIIKKLFNLSESTLRYHLNYLESKNEIKSYLKGRNRYYYPVQKIIINQGSKTNFEIYNLNEKQERILDTIQRNPGITQKDLIVKSGLKGFIVRYNIKKLIDFGVIQKTQNGRNCCYNCITDSELREKMMRRLIVKFLNHEIDEQTFLMLSRKLE